MARSLASLLPSLLPALAADFGRPRGGAELLRREAPGAGNESSALGLLVIDYAYPTQAGDIDDKRSFCSVSKGYRCVDSFTVVKAKIAGLTFEKAQKSTWNAEIQRAFEAALFRLLVNPRVRAITGNCGFLAHYQQRAEAYAEQLSREGVLKTPRPIKLSTLDLIQLVVDGSREGGWGLQSSDEKVLVITANKNSLSPEFESLLRKLQVDNVTHDRLALKEIGDKLAQATWANITREAGSNSVAAELAGDEANRTREARDLRRVVQLGAELTPGFGREVAQGNAHRVVEATIFLVDEVRRFLAAAKSRRMPIKHILLECTELPAYANALRLSTGLPVWDVVTLGACMMRSQLQEPVKGRENIYAKRGFKSCMLDDGQNLNTRFGLQSDNTTEGYAANGSALGGTVRLRAEYSFNVVLGA